ncbi:MAG: 4Fe-4S dicluster domain-containing protein [Chloroflexi bacterium]|nr:4Fe-4S dicluster domain-containing protein [Chloroflexota bacterium]
MKPRILINQDWCKGCYLCVSVCPRDVLDIDRETWLSSRHPVLVRQPERCTACRNCELLCPDLAIEVIEADDNQRVA